MSTGLLERTDEIMRPVRGRPTPAVAIVMAIVIALAAGVVIDRGVALRTQVGRERSALTQARTVEGIARHTLTSVETARTTARASRAHTLALDLFRQTQRANAELSLCRIAQGISATTALLTNTETAQNEIAQYSALRDACIAGVRNATAALQHGDSTAAVAALRAAADSCTAALAAVTGARFPYDFPDPSILAVGSRDYAYSTNSGVGNIQVLTSTDLTHWSIVGDALAGLPGWAAPGDTWAPAVLARPNGYVVYYTVRDRGSKLQCVSVAASFSPTGPFVDSSVAPLVCQPGGSIDPSPFVDASGSPWLLWKGEANGADPATLWSQPLSPDGLTLQGDAAALLTPAQSWEHGVVEGPSMVRIGAVDYLFYSGGFWTTEGYAEGVAECAGPSGPCHRILSKPVLATEGRLGGPGGGFAFTTSNGDVWLAFHAFTEPDVGYPNSRTFHLATVKIVRGVPVVTPQ